MLVGFLGKGAHIDIESVGQREQDARRHRALIAFQQIEIARGEPERRSGLGLGHAAFAPQAPQSRAGKNLLEGL